MFQGFTGWHALIILVVILLLFGAPKLPALARSLGQSMKILKNEVRSDGDAADGTGADTADAATDQPKATGSSTDTTKS
ncbi:twin-arginine translocase TatA/TatE family subunit [Agromyces larvae]|uniref:Sec-independent protein translocase protein TatA n=1 Tax=Agromyces larvae TaxID=2929802 RepID=A0ABY4C0S6_9MICO|nr:twin-arginine translocase TatA/TatE family subunit [Agromyces larvae]UOE45087.1 twin-arginine translocase TatA/TatE family subunit [Agromyces larvae]